VEILLKINYRDAHTLRGPVATILGLINIIESEDLIHHTNKTIVNHLKSTVEKLDDIVTTIYRESVK
jgi:hypothetical protein